MASQCQMHSTCYALHHPQLTHTSHCFCGAVRRVKEQKGIRLWVEGSIKTADGSLVLATCEAMLADMSQFM